MSILKQLSLATFNILLFSLAGFSQLPNPGLRDSAMRGGMNRDSALRNMPAICKVIGTLQDSLTKSGLEFTSVAVLKVRDSSIVGGTLTNGKGQFSIEALQPGRYFLRISAIGYRKMDSKPFMLNPMDPTKDFGIVYVASSQKNLKEVEVQGERADYVNSLDKKIYNVERDLVSTGGTASDVLRNVPSVNVDIDGKISLRGSENLTILIDGKPSSLGGGDKASLLQQLPAGSIDQIEIITNPSARYDAEGMAGIINIKTKKDKRSGINGSVTLGAGTRDKYNGGVSFNNRTKKTNLNLSYNFREETRRSSGFSTRQNELAFLYPFEDAQSEGRNQNHNNSIRSSLDINLSNNTTIGLSGGFSERNENKYELNSTVYEDSIRSGLGGFYRTANSSNSNMNLEGGVDIRHVIPGTKREWSGSANYSQSENNDNDYYLTVDSVFSYSTLKRKGQFSTLVTQTDYTHPINQNAKFETGLKGTFRTSDNDQVGLNRDGFDVANTDHFIYSDEITAAYLQFAGKAPTIFKKDKFVELQGGVRVENTKIIGDAVIDVDDFEYNYTNLFPSAAIKYTVKEKSDFQLVYSKRVNRPNPQNLNPFTDISDVRNVRTGNPRLQPEFIDSYEFNYFRKIKEHSVSATLYYRYTKNLISRFRSIDSLTGVSTMTFINYSSSANTGLEIVVKNQFGKSVSSTTTFNYFNNKINGENIDAALQSTSNNWTLRGNINIKASKTTSLQITGMYMSAIRNPQGTFRGMSGIDIGARRDFMKGKLNLSINITDILDTRKMIIHNVGEGFVYDAERKRESRVANFTLVYRFGSNDANLFQRKKASRQMDMPMDINPDF
ncbi:MAG: TonB-dependent receptor domain-containing protein [Bacteroidota bacterium]|jgi:outer membrane receptor protein involved in Fe transport